MYFSDFACDQNEIRERKKQKYNSTQEWNLVHPGRRCSSFLFYFFHMHAQSHDVVDRRKCGFTAPL